MLWLAAPSAIMAQTAGGVSVPSGTYYFYNTGARQYLVAGVDGSLGLSSHGTAVDVSGTVGAYTLNMGGRKLGGGLGQPVVAGATASVKWQLRPAGGAGATYVVGNMQREANAYANLYYSESARSLATMAALPADTYTAGQWRLVGEADYAANAVTLDEASYDYERPVADAEHPAEVTLKRSFVVKQWNTLCLPFALSHEQLVANWQADASDNGRLWLAAFSSYDADGTLHFVETTSVEAGKPCLIYPTKKAGDNTYVFSGVDYFADKPQEVAAGGCVLKGLFAQGVVPTGAYAISDNKVVNLPVDVKTYGMRCYFVTTEQQRVSRWTLDGAATAVGGIDGGQAVQVPFNVYSVDGKLLKKGTISTDGLPQGVYMMKGKKIMK